MTEPTPPPSDPWQQPTGGWAQAPAPPASTWSQAPQQAGGWAPAPTRPTNAWAVVALVTGIIALVPVAVAAGIVALVQIRKRDEGGTPMAVIGLVAAGLWTLVIGGAIAAAIAFGDFDYDGEGRVADAGTTTVGGCLNNPTGAGSVATVVGCATTHDAEVYLVQSLGGGAWPGHSDVVGRADRLCDAGFEPYVGESYFDSDYDYGFYVPDEQEWTTGEHRVVCVILPGMGDNLRGTVRDGGAQDAEPSPTFAPA